MKKLIENFPAQIHEAIDIGKKVNITKPSFSFDHIVISGLGGSGIGASIVQEYISQRIHIPFTVHKEYHIPGWVSEKTLFIACSYSGNTEETLMAVKAAHKRKAHIVCITSGGTLAAFAEKNKYPLFQIPSGMPPRACLGYSMTQLLWVLHKYNFIQKTFVSELTAGVNYIQANKKAIQQLAKKIVQVSKGKKIAIYATAGHEGMSVRFRQQLQENAKILAWSNVIPEMTHNEIVGWTQEHTDLAVIFMYAANDFDRNLIRMQVLKNVCKKHKSAMIDLCLQGKRYFEQIIYGIHVTDWVSVYLADEYGADAMEVRVIDYLKSTLAKK